MILQLTVYGLLAAAALLWAVISVRLFRASRRYHLKDALPIVKDSESLPSVSVCIPARNEVHAMVDCLERVIASDYPKLEIIVLDDHSKDDTPHLIRSFASAGVRFVEGSALPDGWIGKNFSLDTLVGQASGSVIFFMDVDTRIEEGTIRSLIALMNDRRVDMLSVLPRRHDRWRPSIFFSPLRYFWELLFDSSKTPSSASNAWLIKRQVLTETQGLEAWKDAIQPETALAAMLQKKGAYGFVIGNEALGVSYEKKWQSQLATSLRLLYPLIGSPSRIVFVLLAMMIMMSPVAIGLSGLVVGWHLSEVAAIIIGGLFMISYLMYTLQVWSQGAIIGALLWPLLLFQEFLLVIISTDRYRRGAMMWRGRPIKNPPKRGAGPGPEAIEN